ncbi:MAG: GNAT family N-acetyltransferase [Sphingobacteriaceae bacterium]|nr:MAG: GNAT family N-acetyltransferase [Sphingobacteriaceae bacterium]
MPDLIFAQTTEEYAAAARLFKEYAGWLNIDLCFQNFDEELQQLDLMYALPTGGIILLKDDSDCIGCVGIRKREVATCEMKRMWIQPTQQGKGLGDRLLEGALELAANCGYQKIQLDTLNHMTPAINLYKKHGFYEIPAYYHNPDPRAVYFEKLIGA